MAYLVCAGAIVSLQVAAARHLWRTLGTAARTRRLLHRIALCICGFYLLMLLIAGLIHNRSSGGAVHAAAHGGKSGGVPVRFVPDELAAGLRPPGTLVLVSISGGGFRAAYFAAAVLQELQHIRIDKAAGLNSLLVYNIGLLSVIESVN